MGHSTEAPTPEEPEVDDADEGVAAKVGAQTIRTAGAKLFRNKTAHQRLYTELATAESELEELIERAGATDESWAVRSRRLLERARDALARGDIDVGWRYLHTAQRFEIHGLETLAHRQERAAGDPGDTDTGPDQSSQRTELELRAATVREEALDTLSGWRRRAVVHLLCDESEALKSDPTGAAVRRASKLLHEQYENTYRKRSERQHHFNHLVVMAMASGLFLFVYTLAEMVWAAPANGNGLLHAFLVTPFGVDCSISACADITKPGFAVFMTAMGVMGAALFGMRSLRRRSLSTKVPQQISQLTVTGARGVIGAISALLLYFALQTDPVVSGTIIAEGVVSPSLMVVVGFAAGYSERMAPNVVATVASLTATDSDEAKTES